MPEEAATTRQCPYCREDVDAEATRCPHCQAPIPPQQAPTHQGVCPFCREAIHPEAIRCKHCKADLAPGGPESFSRGQRPPGLPPSRRTAPGRHLVLRRTGRPCGDQDVERDRGVDPSGCLEVVHAGGAMYCLEYVYWEIDTNESWCTYTECAQA